MSRDQRPRSTVMIDTGPLVPETAQAGVIVQSDAAPAGAGAGAGAGADNPPIILWSIVFLFTCSAVALGIALLPSGNPW